MKLMTRAEAVEAGKLDSPEYNLACRVRFACALDTVDGRRFYLDMIERNEGKEYGTKLRQMVREHWTDTREDK